MDTVERNKETIVGRGMSFISYLAYYLKREFSKVAGCYTVAQEKEPLNNAYSLDAPASANPEDEITLGETLPFEETGFEKVEEALYNTYASGVVREAVKSLPDQQRIAIEKHYFEGKSFAEIGRSLNVAGSTAVGYANRGKEKLRRGKYAPALSELLYGEHNLYHHTGYTSWKETGYSVQEWNVFHCASIRHPFSFRS